MPEVRILLADNHTILREGVRSLLEEHDDCRVIGEASDGLEAVRLAGSLDPDIVMMDVGLPRLNGIDATRRIVARNPGVAVIALSMHADTQFVTEMLRAGAKGYVLKDSAFDELRDAITAVASGGAYVSPQLSGHVLTSVVGGDERNGVSAVFSRLTPREREVLQHIAEGKATAQIAETLFISAKTVESHRKNLMDKLGIRNVVELTKLAIREGLISLDD